MKNKMTVMLAMMLAMIVNMTSYAEKTVIVPTYPRVEVSTDGTTLTFFKDTHSYDYLIEDEYNDAPAWCSTKVTKVVFDASFSHATPSSTAYWFSGCTNLKTIEGLENLRFDSVQCADYMFYSCKSLTILDLSGFNAFKLTRCYNMFAQCSNLKTIYGNTWNILDNMSDTERVDFINYQLKHGDENYMFNGCTSLVGGSGTKYDSSIKNKDYTYCHIDGGTANPGFFTFKAATLAPYAVLAYGVLTLYYDNLRHERVGRKFDITFGEAPGYCGYNAIKEINIDSSMRRLAPTSMSSLFKNLYEVVTIRNIGNLNTSRVTDMSNMFYNCCSLIILDLSDFNTQSVTNMMSMFGHCFSLSYLDLSSLNTTNVTNMANMFYRCMSLKSVNLSSFNTSNVTDMSGMFRECVSLQTLNLSNFNTERVTKMQWMFGNQIVNTNRRPNPAPEWYSHFIMTWLDIQTPYKLETIDVSSFNTANVTDMSGMFEYQPALTTIYVGNSWSTAKVSSSSDMFKDSYKLVGGSGTTYDFNHVDHLYAHVDGGINNPGYLTLKGGQGGTGIKEAYAILNGGTLTFYYDDNKDSRSGKKYDVETSYTSSKLPGWATDSLSIKKVSFASSFANYYPTSTAYWFGGYYKNLNSLTGVNNLKTDYVTAMNHMFFRCSALTNLDLSNLNTSNVTTMRSMFNGCTSLNTLNISGLDTHNVTNMYCMFYECNSLKQIDVTHFNTAKVTNMGYMFYNCKALTSLELRNFDTSNVTIMGWMFLGCSSLTELNISTFDTSKVTEMRSMFNGCKGLTNIDVSGFNTLNVTTMAFMFYGCSKLEKLYVGGFYTNNVTEMQSMFYGCSALTTIYAKDTWNTNKVTNSANMFSNCSKLVGGAGTKYNSSNVDKVYAHIDGGTSNPGYFTNTIKSPWPSGTIPYVVYNNKVMTFYYDDKGNSRAGDKYVIEDTYTRPTWTCVYDHKVITKAVFDSSFASYQPTSTAYWFFNCEAMTTIEGIANLKTSKVTSMAEMFRYCDKLNNLDLRTFDTSNVTDMSCMFCYCHSLTNLNISNFNTAKVINMEHLFHQCPFSSVNVSSFNTSNVKNMFLMFSECKNLTTIYASNLWSTASVTNGLRMFSSDTELVGSMGTTYSYAHTDKAYAHIDGGRCNPGYLSGDITPTDLGPKEAYAVLDDGVLTFYYDSFKECTDGKIYPIESGYSYTHLPAWHEDRSQIMAGAFDASFADYRPINTSYWFYELSQMATLKDVVNLNTSEVSWMSSMFWDCNSLRMLDVSNFDTSKVKTMHGMFGNCRQLYYLDVSRFNTDNVEDMSYMFWGCNSLTKLDVSKFNTANVKNMYGMFYDCKNLKTIDVSKFNTANVENMAVMFMRCEVLENLNLKNFNTSRVVDMNRMFYMCYKLQSLDVSSFNTSNVTDMRSMFDLVKSVKKLDLRNFNTSKVKNMNAMFSGSNALEEIIVTSFDTRNVEKMNMMFHECSSLKNLDLSSFNTANVDSMYCMFWDCTNLTTIYVNSDWNTNRVVDDRYMFYECPNLTGGSGTKYNSSHVGKDYARIDGGTSRPGYFTYKAMSCDVNGDGNVDVADIATIIDVMAGSGDAAMKKAADVNGDGNVDVADIATVIDRMAELARRQQALTEEE